jgi:hypothetical protein
MTLIISKGITLRKGYIGTDDPDAEAYIAAVEAADEAASPGIGPLETATKVAIHSFIKGCKNDGIWPSIKASCILAGARTLTGALVPLAGAAPTNVGGLFVSGDYNRKTGLVGNGSTKYLDSNYAYPTSLQNNCHVSGYYTAMPTVGPAVAGIVGGYANSASGYGTFLSVNNVRLYSAASSFIPTNTTSTGFRGLSRSSASSYIARAASTNETANVASTEESHQNMGIFARRRSAGNYDFFSDHRLAFYSIGESLNLALLDARVTDLINAFGAAIP